MSHYRSFLSKIQKANRDGLPACYQGKAEDFLVDHYPELPWNPVEHDKAVAALQADPAWPATRDEFKAKFGVDIDQDFAEAAAANL